MRIGLLSDTHLPSLMRTLDELGPAVGEALRGCDLILHGGDVVAPFVLDWCEAFAPVLAAEGNNDLFRDPRMSPVQLLEVDGWRIGMAHELRPESRPIAEILASSLGRQPVDILVGGDTHVERLEFRDQVVLMNSGSPVLPHHLSPRLGSVGVLEISRDEIRAEIVTLGHTPGAPNPARPLALTVRRNGDGHVYRHHYRIGSPGH